MSYYLSDTCSMNRIYMINKNKKKELNSFFFFFFCIDPSNKKVIVINRQLYTLGGIVVVGLVKAAVAFIEHVIGVVTALFRD